MNTVGEKQKASQNGQIIINHGEYKGTMSQRLHRTFLTKGKDACIYNFIVSVMTPFAMERERTNTCGSGTFMTYLLK